MEDEGAYHLLIQNAESLDLVRTNQIREMDLQGRFSNPVVGTNELNLVQFILPFHLTVHGHLVLKIYFLNF